MKNLISVFSMLVLLACSAFSATFWEDADPNTVLLRGEKYIVPVESRTVKLDIPEFLRFMSTVPNETTTRVQQSNAIFSFPLPNGTMGKFRVVESSVMAPELQAQYPNVRTYLGQGIDDPYATVRFDFTTLGFHAMILSPHGTVFIDPFSWTEMEYYTCYNREDFRPSVVSNFACLTGSEDRTPVYTPSLFTTGEQLRTYRTAIATTVEYTSLVGAANVNSNVVTTLNRITGVYEIDLCVRMTLIANNNILYYSGSDPYTNNNGSALLSENQSNLDAVIGNANYDIGHVFSTGTFGGIAGLRVVCVTGSKARGATGSTNPVGDPWSIDYVAHEMGHQFGGNHTQNNTSCNANSSTAWEPGSGVTIMGYAGVCNPSLANNSIATIHGGNQFNEMIPYTQTGNGSICPVVTNTGNTPPTVTVPTGGFTIPISTYFALTGSATDPNGDALTYSWEEIDLGPQGNPNTPSGDAPIMRPFLPVTNGTRTFPKLSDIINNTQTLGELLPTYTRNLNFRLTVRDNRAGGPGVNKGDVAFQTTSAAGPFLVTFPNTNVTIGGGQHILWSVANTTAAPVSCANVKISLSTDGGTTFPTVLIASTPNDGTQLVTLPSMNNSTARIKVEAVGNIFFDISNTNFTINTSVGIGNNTGTPIEFGLSQNFPNPFNPVTLISYGIPTRSAVTLKIYDVTGQLVSTLINNEIKTEGYYKIEYNASNLPSGVYYYEITAGEFKDVKKMVLVK